ncbi:MAG: glycosyltransferase family 4 protein [Mesorhizobium sp.]
MRIVEVCPYDMARPGGVQNHVRDLAAWLSNERHEVVILAPRSAVGQAEARLRTVGRQHLIRLHGTVTEISLAGRADMAALRRSMAEFRPDIVHLHTPWTPLMPWQAWRAIGRPTVATFHATLPDPTSMFSRALLGAARYFLKRIEAGIVPSGVPLKALPKGGDLAPVTIIPPAVDLAPWFAASRPRNGIDVSVVFLGRLEHRKGVDVLMRAWELAAPRLVGARLTIAGSGPLQGGVQSWSEGRADATYLPAPDAAKAQALFGSADIVVASSRNGESFGLVLGEAMAAGAVPVAAANAGYASTLAGPHADNLLYPPEDAGELASRLVELADNRDLRLAICDWGRERARAIDMPAVGPRYVELFDGVLSGRIRR